MASRRVKALPPPRALEADERVVLFPTTGWREHQDAPWQIRLRGWIFEPEPNSRWRSATSMRLAKLLGRWLPAHADRELAAQLFRWFLVDHERGKHVDFEVGGSIVHASASLADGRFTCDVEMPAHLASGIHSCRLIDAPHEDCLAAPAYLTLAENQGISIICDIDDTLKKSEVFSRRLLIHNTFYQPWEPVGGMAQRLMNWSRGGAPIHYVSAMPWPLYLAFSRFCQQHGFPAGSVDMRDFRLRDRSLFRFFGSSRAYKMAKICALVTCYSQRRFILIGDSGENDPEVYSEIAQTYPERIVAIWIRNLDKSPADHPRWQAAFGPLKQTICQLFDNGDELPDELETLPTLRRMSGFV